MYGDMIISTIFEGLKTPEDLQLSPDIMDDIYFLSKKVLLKPNELMKLTSSLTFSRPMQLMQNLVASSSNRTSFV